MKLKTVDNDLAYVDRTFGFETAIEQAQAPILAAHQEARSVFNGIGLVKLMGRDSGFIALNACNYYFCYYYYYYFLIF